MVWGPAAFALFWNCSVFSPWWRCACLLEMLAVGVCVDRVFQKLQEHHCCGTPGIVRLPANCAMVLKVWPLGLLKMHTSGPYHGPSQANLWVWAGHLQFLLIP